MAGVLGRAQCSTEPQEVTGASQGRRGEARRGHGKERGGCRVHEHRPGGYRGTRWPWPAGAAAGLWSELTPGQGGEEREVCAAGAHSLGGNVGTPHGAPVPGTNSKTTCFLLLTPGAWPAPPIPPHPGGGSARGMKASGSSGSRLGAGQGQEEGWGSPTR